MVTVKPTTFVKELAPWASPLGSDLGTMYKVVYDADERALIVYNWRGADPTFKEQSQCHSAAYPVRRR